MKALGICLALASFFYPQIISARTLAITHAEAWTMVSDAPVDDATIIIENGKIISVIPGGDVPQGATVIDARGKPVTPGLMNAATQVGLVEIKSSTTRDEASADDRNRSFDPSRALNGNSTLIDLIRADGVTRAFVYPAQSSHALLSGEPVIARFGNGIDILESRQVAVYTVIGGGASEKLGSRAQQWAVLRQILIEAKGALAKRDTSDNTKHSKREPLTQPSRSVGDDLLFGVVSRRVPLAIQTNRESDIRQAIQIATDLDIRVVITGGAEAWRVADELAAANIAVVLDPSANLPTSFDELGARQDSAAILMRAGVSIAFGMVGGKIHMTYNAGIALRESAGIAVANGLPYADAMRAVTVNPRTIWGKGGGTLTAEADADLVVWDGDPLEPSSRAVHVIVEGQQVSTQSRQDLLAERYRDVR